MCNPRRVTVTATREIQESWQREVERRVELSTQVVGEARVTRNLGDSLGESLLVALRRALSRGVEGWHEEDGAYRHEVEGGYVLYRPTQQTLDIVATETTEVVEEATARRRLEGEVSGQRSIDAGEVWYDDHWGGRTQEWANKEAEAKAERRLDQQVRQQVHEDQQAAEQEVEDEVQEEAHLQAQERLDEAAEAERRRRSELARENLQNVGVRCNLAFNQLLAGAMRDTLAAYARRNQGTVHFSENQDTLDMEILLDS